MGSAPPVGALAVLVLASTALAESAAGDKSRYHLFNRVGMGAMLEADAVFDETNDGYDAEIATTAVVGSDLTKRIGVYAEAVGIASSDADVDYRVQLGVGGTYSITDDLMLDAGSNVGLTGEVDDVNPFVGMTVRF